MLAVNDSPSQSQKYCVSGLQRSVRRMHIHASPHPAGPAQTSPWWQSRFVRHVPGARGAGDVVVVVVVVVVLALALVLVIVVVLVLALVLVLVVVLVLALALALALVVGVAVVGVLAMTSSQAPRCA